MNKTQNHKSFDKATAVDATLQHILKALGEGSVVSFEKSSMPLEVLPTGSISLDIALGAGGYPYGRMIEIYGPESSGKTTLALHAIAESQKRGGFCVFIDMEHALDPAYAAKIGVKFGKHELVISQPKHAEEALELVDIWVRSKVADVIVLDSVAALVPKAELEGDMGDSHMGLQARLMSQALRKLTGSISSSKSIVIFINQIRQKIGVMFGSPETTTGGTALKFYSSIRMDVRRISTLKKGEDSYGNQVKVKIVKNKVAAPFKSVEIEVLYGTGICKISELINLGVKYGLLNKAGSWYSLNGNKIGQGQDSVKKYFEDNPQIALQIEEQIKHKASNTADIPLAPIEEDEDVIGDSDTLISE